MLPEKHSHLFPVQCVQSLDGPGVQLDGLGDVGQHLFEGVSRLLVQQDPHGFPGLHAAADHRHQLGLDEVLALPALSAVGTISGDGARRHPGRRRGGTASARWPRTRDGAGLPAWDGDLGVLGLPVGLVGGTNVAFTFMEKREANVGLFVFTKGP